jgi:hypothetical protein
VTYGAVGEIKPLTVLYIAWGIAMLGEQRRRRQRENSNPD